MAEPASGLAAPDRSDLRSRSWLGVYLHYRGDLNALLRDAVGPLVRELLATGVADDYFFLRYWDGGSHVRLRLALRDPGEADRAREAIAEHATGFFTRSPSGESLSPDEYARVAAQLAERENRTGYLQEQRPNNSYEFVPYRPEYRRYGTGRSLAAVESHFCDSSRAALALVDREPSRAHRDLACLSMLLIAWLAAGADLRRLAADVHTLCEAWGTPESTVDLEAAFARQRGRLTGLAARLRALRPDPTADAPSPDGSGLGAWAASFRRLSRALEPEGGDVLGVLDTCAHLACNRLGAPMPDETYLRQLAARALCCLAEGS